MGISLRIKKIAVFLLCIFLLSGCGALQDEEAVLPDAALPEADVEESTQKTDEEEDISLKAQEADDGDGTQETDDGEDNPEESDDKDASGVSTLDDTVVDKSEAEVLLDAFLAGEIPAYYDYREEGTIMYDQLPHDENDWERYSVGERIDLDNDGEVEQIVNGPYGGKYFDARDGKVYVLAEGEGTTGLLSYANYDNATWIVHSDIIHSGRELHWLTRYDGEGKIVDAFKFGAEYWDSPDDKYDENSKFTYRDEEISMSEYEELYKEIFGE